MKRTRNHPSSRPRHYQVAPRIGSNRRTRRQARPAYAYRQRGVDAGRQSQAFSAPEVWHEPVGREDVKFVVEPPGDDYTHPLTTQQVRERIAMLPRRFTRDLEVVQFSRMTRKRSLFPNYGMQWGSTVYLYPIETSLVETYVRPPQPLQLVEAKMYGGKWSQKGNVWLLSWSWETIRDFYINNVLIHEIGHIHDDRNSNLDARERYANWFAIEYGYRASRGRR